MIERSSPPAEVGHAAVVLVYRIGQLGDSLVAIPAVHAIRAHHPQARMILLTDRHPVSNGWVSSWDVLGAVGVFDDVEFYEPARSTWGALALSIGLGRRLRDLRPEIVYNLAPARTHWQRFRDRTFFVNVVGASNYKVPAPLDRHVLRDKAGATVPARPEWERLLGAIGDRAGSAVAALPVPDDVAATATSLLQEAGGSPRGQWIAIGPGSKMQAKRWPASSFASVIESLHSRFPDHEFLIFGDANDTPIGDQLAARLGPFCVNLAGRLSIMQSAALLARCSVYIGNDTGTMHLAAAAGCPCIAIFSARDRPGLWEPFGTGHRVFQRKPPCAGCMLETCVEKASVCLTQIAADDVVGAAAQVLSGVRRPQVANA